MGLLYNNYTIFKALIEAKSSILAHFMLQYFK